MLQSVYFNKKCNLFYICLLVVCSVLIVTTIVEGASVTDNQWFVFTEACVNSLVTIDYGCRVYMAGLRKFFYNNIGKPRMWNWFDTCVVFICNLMFALTLSLKNNMID